MTILQMPTVGPNGEIYVCWARDSKLYFNFSLDEGETWLEEEVLIGAQMEGWAIDIPGIYRCNGMPVTSCDISNSKYKGTIYVNWADQRKSQDFKSCVSTVDQSNGYQFHHPGKLLI